MYINALFTVPRSCGGINPPVTKAAVRVPPSHAVHFRPSSGLQKECDDVIRRERMSAEAEGYRSEMPLVDCVTPLRSQSISVLEQILGC